MQEENKTVLARVLSFAEDKGFYIILCLCILAIGVSGYVLFFTGDGALSPQPIALEGPPLALSTTAPLTRPAITVPETAPVIRTDPKRPPDEVAVVNPTEVLVPVTEAARPVTVPAREFTQPVKGEVIRPFSGQELVFDDTMGDWRVHTGTDFACAEGDTVSAMTAGTISAVFSDPLRGFCVSIKHEGGLISTTCGLTLNETVKVGQEVTAGTAIGTAGNTVLAESAQAPHIHVELTRDGQHIDPMSLFE